MKNPFTKIIWSSFTLFAVAVVLFVSMLIYFKPERHVVIVSVVFISLMVLLFISFVLALRKEMLNTLFSLSRLIQDLINGQMTQMFPVQEDTLLSKLQHQVIQLSELLSSQKQRYREESQEVKTLISDISHQLKTPLANLGMYNSLLMDEGLPAETRSEFTRHMGSQIEKLSWLMENLIKLSRLESGIIELHTEKYGLENTVLSAIKQAFPAAEQKNIEILLESDQGIMLQHDPKWTGEAIYNIIDNALKYTLGSCSVRITIRRYDLFARIDVADGGIGIPAAEMNDIFKRFYRGAGSNGTEGVGIGLYLARKIVTEQGGYIKVRSELSKGSVFSIFLPLR
ncbi:sensor histidine kinase [Paenibacillus sp. FSL K6-2859]|uniref:sensor histidine kinase n=1 Tax=Paenibacillus sp. FSL K6-2859 TaxID=2921482 RepID=UPI0030F88F96